VFSNPLPWQTLAAFLFARGVRQSNLGNRAAYMLVAAFGRTPLSLSYSLVRRRREQLTPPFPLSTIVARTRTARNFRRTLL
jgi:hypothetical protein